MSEDSDTATQGEATAFGRTYPMRTWRLPEGDYEGADVDIIEMSNRGPRPQGAEGIHIPTHIVINGQKIFMPAKSMIKVEAGGADATTITMTFFARRVRIGHAADLEDPEEA